MKVLVTGANGYLGQGIVKQLLDCGHQVIATDLADSQIDARAERVVCNIFDIKNPYSYFSNPDVLLHLAWRDGFIHYSNSHINDLAAHYQFIKRMADSDIKTIAVMGTMHEIGFYEGSINEETPCNPITPYGITKNALRMLTKMLCQKNNKVFLWLRAYYIVGNSANGESIFSKITRCVAEGKRTFPFTQGENRYDFLDYEDFCKQVSYAIVQDKVQGVINICSGFPERLCDRVERFIKDEKYDIKLQYGVYPDRSYDSKAVWGDSDKIKEIIKSTNGFDE